MLNIWHPSRGNHIVYFRHLIFNAKVRVEPPKASRVAHTEREAPLEGHSGQQAKDDVTASVIAIMMVSLVERKTTACCPFPLYPSHSFRE